MLGILTKRCRRIILQLPALCKIKIQRIPKNDATRNFITSITWVTKQDTVWNSYTKDVLIGHDTTFKQLVKKELVSTIQTEELIIEKTQRVHSETNANSNRTFVFFTLPQNRATEYEKAEVVSWAYWIGVGNEANEAWKQNSEVIKGLATSAASSFTTPLGALAVGAVTELIIPKIGEDVSYALVDAVNKDLFMS